MNKLLPGMDLKSLYLRKLLITVLVVTGFYGCSDGGSAKEAYVKGQITVADSIDASKNYGDIGVVIIKKDSSAAADTLFSAVTNKKGVFSGTAIFPERRLYTLVISRNEQNLGRAGVILADKDSVNITAELPGIAETIQINSYEHKALKTYQRVEKGFQRVGLFARAGRLKGDSLTTELKKWPDIYWNIYDKYPQTLAGTLSAKKSIELLSEWDKPAMMQKINQIDNRDDLVYLAATYGVEYKTKNESLEPALTYLKDLESKTEQNEARMRIKMRRIDLLYDSARVEEAGLALKSFKKEFTEDKVAKRWAESVEYDLSYLSPGDAIPTFSFTDNGQTVSRENLKGSPYMLEITALSNPLYQQQYDRTVVIHSLYKNYDFEVVTIPLDTSRVTVQAFFDERVKPWPVAPAKTFNTEELIDRFNIHNLPTRFLIDREGRIIRRYVGDEYDEVIQGIQQIMKDN